MRKIKFKLILRVGSIVITISNYLTKIRNGEREVKCENEVPPQNVVRRGHGRQNARGIWRIGHLSLLLNSLRDGILPWANDTMAAKKTFSSWEALGSLVYSTGEVAPQEEEPVEQETIEPSRQRLTVRRDASGRKGKVVTLVEGFQGGQAALEALAGALKRYCGTGGSVKDAVVLIQGDVRQKVGGYLSAQGYKVRVL